MTGLVQEEEGLTAAAAAVVGKQQRWLEVVEAGRDVFVGVRVVEDHPLTVAVAGHSVKIAAAEASAPLCFLEQPGEN